MRNTPPSNRFSRASGFTLIELLVLIAIAGILCAILIPVAALFRDHARGATCASNLGKVMNAMYLYAEDHEGRFPPPSPDDLPPHLATWHSAVALYAGFDRNLSRVHQSGITWRSNSFELNVFTCPTSMTELVGLPNFDGVRLNPWFMYGLNADLPTHAGLGPGRRSTINVAIDDLQYPSQTMAILETSDWSAVYNREIRDSTGTGAALVPHGNAANVAFYDGSVRRIPTEELIAIESTSIFWAGGFAE